MELPHQHRFAALPPVALPLLLALTKLFYGATGEFLEQNKISYDKREGLHRQIKFARGALCSLNG